MIKFFTILCLAPLFVLCQKPIPRLEGDTLYTSSGFKMYTGQTIQLAKGTGNHKEFRFIFDAWNLEDFSFDNCSVKIKQFKKFVVSGLGNAYVYIKVKMTLPSGKIRNGELKVNFDKAIQPFAGLPAEIVVPDEFVGKKAGGSVADEIQKLNKLYQDSVITKEEFEAQKKKILEKQ